MLVTPVTLSKEPVAVDMNDVAVGTIRAGAFGHTLSASVGLGYVEADGPVTRDFVSSGDWEIEIAGRRHPARASLHPLYDPKGERIRT